MAIVDRAERRTTMWQRILQFPVLGAFSLITSTALRGTISYFFFFQAEDGIRDYKVTGVQTCALPISENSSADVMRMAERPSADAIACTHSPVQAPTLVTYPARRPRVSTLCATRAMSDRKSTRLNSSHLVISYAVFCLKKKKKDMLTTDQPATTDHEAPVSLVEPCLHHINAAPHPCARHLITPDPLDLRPGEHAPQPPL